MRDLNFACTGCGECCSALRLPLSTDEALRWLGRGHEVQVLCEAIPWPGDPPAGDDQAEHKRRRSFLGWSGVLPVRVIVSLVASFEAACPNLGNDKRCAIYDERPAVCRIYPAEMNPFVPVRPEFKSCPPEAWGTTAVPLLRNGAIVDDATRSEIHRARLESVADVSCKERVCSWLNIRVAALSNDGYVAHVVHQERLAQAIRQAGAETALDTTPAQWRFVSDSQTTLSALGEIGAVAEPVDEGGARAFKYLRARPDRAMNVAAG